jgi:hypothetical protein
MYPGDQGPLKFKRTTEVLGLPPPTKEPIAEEIELLRLTSGTKVVADARAMLAEYGVKAPTCSLGDNPCLLMLGEPRLVVRGAARLVVSKVLNSKAGWSAPSPPVDEGKVADNGLFGDKSTAEGFYSNDPLRGPLFVHKEEDGQAFYDNLTACVINGGILFNMHSDSSGQSVYHEVLHLFEGGVAPMTNSTYLKEGIVEFFSDLFLKRYGKTLPMYKPYAAYVTEINKLVAFVGKAPGAATAKDRIGIIARAYFGNDPEAYARLVPAIYKPTGDKLPQMERLSDMCQREALTCSCFRDLVSPFKMKAKGSWYRNWVADNGGVPAGGVALPPG